MDALYIKDAINNLPALKFANNPELRSIDIFANDFISSDETTIFLVQNNFSGDSTTNTLSWVSTIDNTDTGTSVAILSIAAQRDNEIRFNFLNTTVGRISITSVVNFLDQNKILSFSKLGSYTDARINFNERSASSSNSNTSIPSNLTAPFIVGKYRGNSSFSFNGYIAEIIIFNRALKEAERYEIEKYLSQKWGIKIG